MSYDKYRNWPLRSKSGNVFPVFPSTGIEKQVIEDLEEAKDPIEKLEILDSFAAYAQRDHQMRLAQECSYHIARLLASILESFILEKMPLVQPVARGRVAHT